MQKQIELMEIGSIAIFTAYNLVLYSQVKRNHYLFLSLLSFFIFIRATLVDDGSMILYTFFSELSPTMGRKIAFFSGYMVAPLSVLFAYSLYPYHAIEKFVKVFLAISSVFLLIVLATPYSFFYHTLDAYYVVILISYVLMFVILIRAIKSKKVGSMYVFTGTVLCFLFVMAELLNISGVVFINAGSNLINSGFVIFLFFQTVALSEVFAYSFKENQELNKNLEQRVLEKTTEISRSSLLRDTLIRIVSHDLRGPLSNLKSVITLTREEQVGIEQAKEFLGTIDKGVDHIIQMLNELTEWGHAASENKRIDQEEIVLHEVMLPISENMKPHIESKELSFDLTGDLETQCLFDRNALKVVIRNLFSNAVKFTEKGGAINVEVHKRASDILVEIRDTGIGISEEMKANLFEMKKDSKRAGTDNEKSSGVGLFICKDLITQNGGTLDVKDNPEGKGTIFKFTLKRAS